MRILIAEDDPTSRIVLETLLRKWGHEVVSASDGAEAWEKLNALDAPRLLILDRMMPGIAGTEICQRIKEKESEQPVYVILLTAMGRTEEVVGGLDAGADDYLVKPFKNDELRARIRAGERMLAMHSTLEEHVKELRKALAHIKRLQGVLPICMHCHKIHSDQNSWQKLEEYLQEHSEAELIRSS